MPDEIYAKSLEIIASEVAERTGDEDPAYAQGLLAGVIHGMGLAPNTFLAIHGSEQRLRHIARQVMIQDGRMTVEPIKGL